MARTLTAPTLTYSAQDYLKCIYDLTTGGGAATTNAIAARLGISAASVTGMLQKLASARPALVAYRKHQGAHLTAVGERAALEIIRHHRLLETWLVHSLGYSWDEVHSEADKLEHAMSENLERRISQALGNPVRDPHGEPIPTAELEMPEDDSVPALELKAGQDATILRVQPADPEALQHLKRLGLSIGTRFHVVSVSGYDKLMTLRIKGQARTVTLGPALSKSIYVERKTRHT